MNNVNWGTVKYRCLKPATAKSYYTKISLRTILCKHEWVSVAKEELSVAFKSEMAGFDGKKTRMMRYGMKYRMDGKPEKAD